MIEKFEIREACIDSLEQDNIKKLKKENLMLHHYKELYKEVKKEKDMIINELNSIISKYNN